MRGPVDREEAWVMSAPLTYNVAFEVTRDPKTRESEPRPAVAEAMRVRRSLGEGGRHEGIKD
jgi:hypothetical protein